jgi:TonB family protein
MRIATLALLGALFCGCEAKIEPAPAAKPSASPRVEALPTTTEPLTGVGPSGAEGRVARRQAALELLTDGRSAALLPIAATEPGEKFDSRLAEKMAPKVWVSDSPRSGSSSQVKQGKATVTGPLDKDIIRRLVRAHINEVRSCYNAGLSENRKLAGRVVINFVIGRTGKVASSVVAESTLSDTTVGNCIAKAVKRWTFPKPRGDDSVIVTYPFDLSPG